MPTVAPGTGADASGASLEVLSLLGGDLRNADIAARLHTSGKTVDHHVSAILARLGVGSRREAARFATARKLGDGDGGPTPPRWRSAPPPGATACRSTGSPRSGSWTRTSTADPAGLYEGTNPFVRTFNRA